jgi:hypothetical protein
MAMLGLDYAWDRPDPHCLASSGYRFVSRYISYDTTGKNLTATEAGALHGAGLDIVLNWEWQKYNAREGYATGGKHGRDANAFAAHVGAPGNLPIYFSVDFDAQPHELVAVAEYFRAVGVIIGINRVGVYGGYNTIDYLYKHGRAKWFWQTYAWSGGRVHSAAHVLQYSNNHVVCGGKGDLNRALKPAFGAWAGKGSSQTPLPAPAVPVDTSSGFDYTGDIAGTGKAITSMASTIAGYSSDINALRNN